MERFGRSAPAQCTRSHSLRPEGCSVPLGEHLISAQQRPIVELRMPSQVQLPAETIFYSVN